MLLNKTGVYIFHSAPPHSEKKRKYKGEEMEKRGKGEIFTLLGERGGISALKKEGANRKIS